MNATSNGSTGPSFDDEEIVSHPKAASPFIALSAGSRACPGRKFSHVEWVAAMIGLFREWRAKPVLQKGEDDTMARKRIGTLVEEDSGFMLLLQLMHPERAVLTWQKRRV
jgi:hypothetical protein